MKITVNMSTTEDKFSVESWYANNPQFVLESVVRQLKAASAIWPELENVAFNVPDSLAPKIPK